MRHLVRAGELLGVLVVAFVGVFFLVRSTSAFEVFGFYPERNNIEEWTNQPLQYVTVSRCRDCHEDEYKVWEPSKHNTVSCESCHGPGKTHLDGNATMVIDTSREFCGLCHNKLVARPSGFPQVDLEVHGRDMDCITCHDRHNPGVALLPPHELEGRLGLCLMCHEEAGLVPFHEDHLGRTVETCTGCHRGLRPPHMLEPPRLGNCLLCHDIGRQEPFPADHAGRSVDTCLYCHHRS